MGSNPLRSHPCLTSWRPKVTVMWILGLLVAGLLTGLASGTVLRTLPEPTGGEQDGKIPYASLASRRLTTGVAACAMAAGLVVAARLPASAGVAWVPLTTVGVLLVSIDALTTWLPLRLTRILWAATVGAAALQILLAPDWTTLALRMLLGAVAVLIFFWGFWWLVGGLGFGDVRLAPVLGAVTASVSWSTLAAGLLLGTVLGAVVGIVRHLRGRTGPFPYGPSLVMGAYLGLTLLG